MKCFILGFIGLFTGAIIFLFGYANYCDYVVEAEIDLWCLTLENKVKEIEHIALKQKQLIDIGKKVKPIVFPEGLKVKKHRILNNGAIIVQGGRDNQVLVLNPNYDGDNIMWETFVGPAKLTPSNCKM